MLYLKGHAITFTSISNHMHTLLKENNTVGFTKNSLKILEETLIREISPNEFSMPEKDLIANSYVLLTPIDLLVFVKTLSSVISKDDTSIYPLESLVNRIILEEKKIDYISQALCLDNQKKTTRSQVKFIQTLSQMCNLKVNKKSDETGLDMFAINGQQSTHFYNFILSKYHQSKAQLFQDIFVLFILNQKLGGTFLEFGATDGVELSNSFMLEKHYGWRGVLAEPSPQWHKKLKSNRPKTQIIKDCIYSETDKILDFFISDIGVLSTLAEFKESDKLSMTSNSNARNKSGYNVKVSTVSLNDVFVNYFNSQPIDYMSVDTEGSELVILDSFDFHRFGPKVLTVEHNFSDNESKLDKLLEQNNYERVFKMHSQFDGWYVKKSCLKLAGSTK
ncbi:MAG: FkbM family methyltransferase [Legionellaceae bacterium]|nr:FkbM family methyltransferase [Legionellaceae bacterium]